MQPQPQKRICLSIKTLYLLEQLIVYCIITSCWNVDSYLKKKPARMPSVYIILS